MRLESVDDLRAVYRPPGRGPVDKVIHRLDEHCVDFLAKSPFFVLSTADADGVCDGSPKGGPPGFVQALDGERLAWADFAGNNRLDSFQNLVDQPQRGVAVHDPRARRDAAGERHRRARRRSRCLCARSPSTASRHGWWWSSPSPRPTSTAPRRCAERALWSPESWLDPDELPVGSVHRQGPRRDGSRRRRHRERPPPRPRDHPVGARRIGVDSSGHNNCARSSMDRASDYGSEGWGFDSLRAR